MYRSDQAAEILDLSINADAEAESEQVREARERAGITQAELAARIGSTQPAIARLEAGGVTPNPCASA